MVDSGFYWGGYLLISKHFKNNAGFEILIKYEGYLLASTINYIKICQ